MITCVCCLVLCICQAWCDGKLPFRSPIACLPGWQLCWLWHGMIQYGSLAGSQLSCRAGSLRALLWLSCQAGSGTVRPARAVAVFQVWQPSSAYQFPLSFVVFIVGLPLTMLSPTVVSFVPVFTAAPVGLDPVAAAMSQVGLPSSLCGQTATVPLVNPAVPPVADLLGGPVAIPGWGSLPPWLTKKFLALEYMDMWELLPESWRLEPAEGGCCHSRRPRRGLVTSFPLWVECYAAYPEKMPHFMAYL